MAEVRPRLDWQEAYARLERARRSLAAGDTVPPAQARQLLKQRAQALAQPLAEAPPITAVLDLVVCALAGEHYGIDMRHVLEVTAMRELTAVPCTPPFVLGVVNHRGRLLAVLDLCQLFALAPQGVTESSLVVAVQAGGMTFGLLTEAVLGIIQVGVHEVAPPPVTLSHDRQAFLQGVTAEMVTVLDLERLVPRILVNDAGVSPPSL